MSPNSPVDGLPHDIHGLLAYQPSLLDRWPWLLAAGLLAGMALALWLWYRRRSPRPQTVAPVDPWDALLARLAQLSPAEAVSSKAREGFFYELSLGLREAVERRLGLRATDMTLAELREPLRRKLPMPAPEVEAVLSFLQRADLVKFAGAPATREEAAEAQRCVAGWVGSLRPPLRQQEPGEVAARDALTTAEPTTPAVTAAVADGRPAGLPSEQAAARRSRVFDAGGGQP